MELYLLSATKISEAKKQFSFYFSNLRLSFYQSSMTAKQEEIKQDLILLQIPWFREGIFICDPKMTVNEFEEAIFLQHGLHVSVQVKLNGVWIDALSMGNLSLGAQNAMAKVPSLKFNLNPATLFL